MRDPETGWVEPDITINGHALTAAEAMTVRVAIATFALWVTNDTNAEALGPIARGYQGAVASLIRAIGPTPPEDRS